MRTGAPGEEARRALAAAREAGPIRTVIRGDPFGMDRVQRDMVVTEAMASGVSGLRVRFTTAAGAAAAPEPHLAIVFDPQGEPSAAEVCRAPETVPTESAGRSVRIVAAFCDADRALGVVRDEESAAGPADHRFKRLLWRTASALFPDDYAETYGFGILPRGIDFGLGGSFGF